MESTCREVETRAWKAYPTLRADILAEAKKLHKQQHSF